VLRRILSYAQKLVGLDKLMQALHDSRPQPRIKTATVGRSVLVMLLTRLGSFNALEQTHTSGFWRRWLGASLPSADTLGRVAATMDAQGVRHIQQEVYAQLKRSKAIQPPWHGLMVAVLDGHESHATFRRCCAGCLQRTIHTSQGDRTQYYHRAVTLSLVGRDVCLGLDAEPQRPGEDEVAAAVRVLDRVLEQYPRAFDVVAGDGLYARGDFFNHVKSRGKDAIAVLKDEQRDLLTDARGLWEQTQPMVSLGDRRRECWDLGGFTTWPQCRYPVRVVRSRETWSVRRQLDKKLEEQVSDWTWVTTLSPVRAPSGAVVQIGHSRWSIENQGFNELVNRWHADHVYKHQSNAILVMWLWTMLACNFFGTFYRRNLKPAVRAACDTLEIARRMLVELYMGQCIQPQGP
jgi:hypothetical protein